MRFILGLPICGLIYAIHLLLVEAAIGSYFSGATPTSYFKGDELNVKVGHLRSKQNWIPLSYYSIPHCQPESVVDTTEFADVFGENSLYKFKMLESEHCHVVCRVTLDAKSAKEFKEKIEDEYRVNMILDDLPVVLVVRNSHDEHSSSNYQQGFNLGLTGQYVGEQENRYFIYNHLSFTIKYNRDTHLNSTNIVGFEVIPYSVHHYETTWGGKTGLITCELHESVLHLSGPQEVKEKEEIFFTYNVRFEESDLKSDSRWDSYAVPTDSLPRWLSILRSLLVIAVVSVKLGKLIFSTIRRPDSSRFSNLTSQGIIPQKETSLTSVNKDALSTPFPFLFCGCIGAGIQVFGVVLSTLFSTTFAFLAPSAILLLVWCFIGLVAGYTSTWLHKLIKGKPHWSIVSLTNAVAVPTAVFIIYSALNSLVHWEISATVANAFTFGSLLLIPTALVGGYLGSRKTAFENQTTTENSVLVRLPDHPWTKRRILYTLVVGILPYAAVDTEIFYLVESVCIHKFYSSYGYLSLSFILLIITCAITTVLQCYTEVSNNNYHCWWQPFLVAGSSALHYLFSSVYVALVRFHVRKPESLIIFFGYILLAVPLFFVMAGTIGFFACFWFTNLFHSAIKTE